MSLNRVCVVGRLTRDPELKYTSSGISIATMAVAVDRFTKDADGKYETDFFTVVAWRRTADFAGQYLTKGRLVSIDGRLQQRTWTDEKSGQSRSVVEIIAENLQGLDKPKPGEVVPHPGGAGVSSAPASDMVPAEADPFAEA